MIEDWYSGSEPTKSGTSDGKDEKASEQNGAGASGGK
jgi:hypothetical protein